MRRWIVATVVLLLAGAAVADDGTARELTRELEIAAGRPVEVSLKVGELQIETAATDKVTVEIEARCREAAEPKCYRRLADLDAVSTATEEGTLVEITGVSKRYHRMEIEATVTVPESSPLVVRMYAGELDVAGGGQDLDIRLKYGDVSVTQPMAATRSALADANFGDAQIYAAAGDADPKRPWMVGSKVTWEGGEGDAVVTVKLSAGDATVHLD